MIGQEEISRDDFEDTLGRAKATVYVARAVLRTLADEAREGSLGETLRRCVRARTLAFAREPTFGELLAARARETPERELITFEEQHISYGELDGRVNAAARGLGELTAEGDNVAIMSENCPEFLEAFFAVMKLGRGVVPVNTALVGDGLTHVLRSSRARVAVVHREQLAALEAVRARLPELAHVVVITEGKSSSRHPTLEQWRTAYRGLPAPDKPPDPKAVALLMYTSGTTGPAKGVVYRYEDSATKRMRLLAHLLYERSDVLYTCLPLFHANALLLTSVQALNLGTRIALARRFSAKRLFAECAKLGATTFNALGAMIPILLKQPPSPQDRAHRVRLVVSAACPAEAWRPFEQRFGVRLVEAYGAVDGGGFVTLNLGNAPVGSIGKPLAGKYRLVNEAGAEVAVNEPGELQVFLGSGGARRVEYYRDEQATASKNRGSWLCTGDLMRRDARGNLYFVGRRGDHMRRRGENVSAHEVESILVQHPAVLEAAVFGVPSELGEDDIMAVVVPVEGKPLDLRELARFLEPRLARHARPRYLAIADELPKTSTHRVQKAALEERGLMGALDLQSEVWT
jgi:crotonobetaine/carnitine-CoA ligase